MKPPMGDIQTVPVAISVFTSEKRETIDATADMHNATPRQLADYKLYELPEATDLPAHETKQVQFLDMPGVPFERIYRYVAMDESRSSPAALLLRLENTAEGGLGKPLPAGEIAVTEPGPGGTSIFIGQTGINDTPTGLPFEIQTGEVFSVQVNETLTGEERTGNGDKQRTQRTLEFEIVNNRPQAIAFELCQYLSDGQTKILSESSPHVVDRGAAVWRIALKAGERVQMRLAVDSSY